MEEDYDLNNNTALIFFFMSNSSIIFVNFGLSVSICLCFA